MNKKPIVTIVAALSMQLATAQRPNIIVILADDMGFSYLGCFGSEIPTPTLIEVSGASYPKIYTDGTELFPLEGFSLVPAFLKGKGKLHPYMYWEH